MAAPGYQNTPGYPPAGPPMPGAYPPQPNGGYQGGAYPPPQGGAYPPPQGGAYPPAQPGALPPQGGAYPPQGGAYPPPGGAYPGGAPMPPVSVNPAPQVGGYPAPQPGGTYPTAPQVGPTAQPISAWQPQEGQMYQGSDISTDLLSEDHSAAEPTAPPLGPPPAFTGYEVR